MPEDLADGPGPGWGGELAFCEVHGYEAEAAALAEITEDAEMELQALRGSEDARSGSNPLLLRALEEVDTPNSDARSGHERDHDKALPALRIV
jgi:hypothetical protein